MSGKTVPVLALLLLTCSCRDKRFPAPETKEASAAPAVAVRISSPAFAADEFIPAKYTADGPDVSPPLVWEQAPPGTKSFALICEDPDAPRGIWVHWVLYNLPPETTGLPEGIPARETIDPEGRQGINDSGTFGYRGPAPPSGVHRYFFRLYCLDTKLDLTGRVSRQQLLPAMAGHVLARGELMGKYRR